MSPASPGTGLRARAPRGDELTALAQRLDTDFEPKLVLPGRRGNVVIAECGSVTEAIKVMPLSALGGARDARRSVDAVRSLVDAKEPNLVRVHGAEMVDDQLFIRMEHVTGDDLAFRLYEGAQLPIGEIEHLAREVATGLDWVWRHKQLVHGDVKPSNVLLAAQAKVVDFRLVRLQADPTQLDGSDADHRLLRTMGTAAYLAPERWNGGQADVRSDIYSFGVVLYEALTAAHPFPDATEAVEYWFHHTEATASPVQAQRTAAPDRLAALVDRCLRKEPSERPAGWAEVLGSF